MAQTLEVLFKEGRSCFTLSKLDRVKLYGSKRRVPVDAHGRECQTAALSRDGRYVLQKGSTAMLYLDESMDVVERDQLKALDAKGYAIECHESSFDKTHALKEKVTAEEVLNFTITNVYSLDLVSISPELDASLSAGDIYSLPFQYRDGFMPREAFLLKNKDGYFLLVGDKNDFEYLGCDEIDRSLPEDESDYFDENLDMAML